VPDAWKDAIDGTTVEVLPLVDDLKRDHNSGWCTYLYAFPEAPEIEFLSGGINSKTPKAAALWRQGNLLHFGFEQSPAEMNETGRALLVNSIVYISRFTEDRPIARTPSPFVEPAPRDRAVIQRLLERDDQAPRLKLYLDAYLAPETVKAVAGKDRQQLLDWYHQFGDYLRADQDGKLIVDEDAQAFGISPARPEFFERAIAALAAPGEQSALVRRLLARYAPQGSVAEGATDEWRRWWTANQPYLFFSDGGGYRWYIDPLAQRRGVPSAEMRGPARATIP
jgi:hypothetical protein